MLYRSVCLWYFYYWNNRGADIFPRQRERGEEGEERARIVFHGCIVWETVFFGGCIYGGLSFSMNVPSSLVVGPRATSFSRRALESAPIAGQLPLLDIAGRTVSNENIWGAWCVRVYRLVYVWKETWTREATSFCMERGTFFFSIFFSPFFFFFFRNAPRYGFDKLSKPVRYIEEPSLRATKVFTAPDLSESK